MYGLQCWQSHEIKYNTTIPNLNYSKIRCKGWQSLRASNMKPHFPNAFDVMDSNMMNFKLTPLATRFFSNRLFRQRTKKAPKHCSSDPGNPSVTGGFRPLRPVVRTASIWYLHNILQLEQKMLCHDTYYCWNLVPFAVTGLELCMIKPPQMVWSTPVIDGLLMIVKRSIVNHYTTLPWDSLI